MNFPGSLCRNERHDTCNVADSMHESCKERSKFRHTGAADALVIADHLRCGKIAKEVYMADYRDRALRTLTRA